MAKDKFVQGYFQLNKVDYTEEVLKQLEELKKNYLIEWILVKTQNGDDLYYALMKDGSRIEDKEVDGKTIPGLMTVMSARNPIILGVWKLDGTPLGKTKVITPAVYEGEELISEEEISYTGSETYPFQEETYVSYMEDIVTYDKEGEIVSSIRPTEPKSIKLFAGWGECIF